MATQRRGPPVAAPTACRSSRPSATTGSSSPSSRSSSRSRSRATSSSRSDNLVNLAFQAAPIGIMAVRRRARVHRRRLRPLGRRHLLVRRGDRGEGVYRNRPRALALDRSSACSSGSGSAIGNGLLVTVARINAFIATLGSSIIIRGLGIAVTGGFLVSIDDRAVGDARAGRRPGASTTRSSSGSASRSSAGSCSRERRSGATSTPSGGNAEAARLSGVRVGVVRATTFAISGLSGGIAGVILASEVGTAQADANPSDRVRRDHRGRARRRSRSSAAKARSGARSSAPSSSQMIGNGFNLLERPARLPAALQGRRSCSPRSRSTRGPGGRGRDGRLGASACRPGAGDDRTRARSRAGDLRAGAGERRLPSAAACCGPLTAG